MINKKMPEGAYVKSLEDLEILPGVPEAIGKLNRAGIKVIVVSNQRGVALGFYTLQEVEFIHAKIQTALALSSAHVDCFYFCPHDVGECRCRKPLPGLFEAARADFPEIDSNRSVMVGDSISDIEFGANLGMRTIYIESDPGTRKAGVEQARSLANFSCASLFQAVTLIFGDLTHM